MRNNFFPTFLNNFCNEAKLKRHIVEMHKAYVGNALKNVINNGYFLVMAGLFHEDDAGDVAIIKIRKLAYSYYS